MYDRLQHAITIGERLGARLVEARLDDFYIREIRTEMDEVRDVKNGEIEYALEPLTIAENFFNALKRITRVGSDSQIMSVGKISSLIIDDLTISG